MTNKDLLLNKSSYSHLQHSHQQLDINENHHTNNHLDDVTHRDNPDNNQNNNNNNHYTSSTILDDNEEFYKSPMYFGTENSTTLTTQIGAVAHIPCLVHNRGEGEVSLLPCFCLFAVIFSWILIFLDYTKLNLYFLIHFSSNFKRFRVISLKLD